MTIKMLELEINKTGNLHKTFSRYPLTQYLRRLIQFFRCVTLSGHIIASSAKEIDPRCTRKTASDRKGTGSNGQEISVLN